jgi:hypothetical protein
MPDYKRISHILIGELSEIIDRAKQAIEAAEEEIICDESNDQNPIRLIKKDENK